MLKALLGPFLKLSKSPEGLETFYGELKEVALYSQHRAALYKHMMESMIEVQGNVALFLDTMSWYSKLKLDTERAITDMGERDEFMPLVSTYLGNCDLLDAELNRIADEHRALSCMESLIRSCRQDEVKELQKMMRKQEQTLFKSGGELLRLTNLIRQDALSIAALKRNRMAVHASAHNDDDDFEHERERTSSFLSSSSRVYQRVASSVPTRTTRAAAKHIRYPEEEVIELMSDEEDLKPVPHARSALQNVDMSLNNFQGSSVGRNGRGLKRSRPSSTDDETLSCSPPVAKKNGRLEDEYEEERGGGGEYTLHGRNNDNDFMAADDIGGGLTGPNKSADGPFCCG